MTSNHLRLSGGNSVDTERPVCRQHFPPMSSTSDAYSPLCSRLLVRTITSASQGSRKDSMTSSRAAAHLRLAISARVSELGSNQRLVRIRTTLVGAHESWSLKRFRGGLLVEFPFRAVGAGIAKGPKSRSRSMSIRRKMLWVEREPVLGHRLVKIPLKLGVASFIEVLKSQFLLFPCSILLRGQNGLRTRHV